MTDLKLEDEFGRVAALHRYEVLDTPQEAAFNRITGLVKTVFNVPMCSVSLIDTDRQWFKSCIGFPVSQTPRDISFCTHTIKAREPLYVPDARLDSRFADNPFVTGPPFIQSYLGVPLSTPDGYNVGSLCAIDVVARTYSEQQIDILKSLAALVVDELELRRIAQTDFLTGAATRRSFMLDLEKTLARFRRSHHPAALLLLDLDHFKQVNDTHGHPAGDVVLRTVAQTLASQLRESDTIGRLGGEEFGILLQDTGREQVPQTAERLRACVEAMQIAHDPPLRVTASFGIAVPEAETSSAEQWLAEADLALYEAKRSGRNRCCTAAAAEAEAQMYELAR